MMAERGYAQNTVAAYRRDLVSAVEAMPSGQSLSAATADDLRQLLKNWSKDLPVPLRESKVLFGGS